jgi:[ribosomal protein S18]-alanine N-acetyltransferase
MTPDLSHQAIRFATQADASDIAALSRDAIEHGLPWTWTEGRIAYAIASNDKNVIVIGAPGAIAGFGIMSYPNDDAHLLLFAVRRGHRRHGLGTRMLRWLEDVAHTAGARRVHVECRRDNAPARNFYCEHGYHELAIRAKWYRGLVDGVLLEKHLVGS